MIYMYNTTVHEGSHGGKNIPLAGEWSGPHPGLPWPWITHTTLLSVSSSIRQIRAPKELAFNNLQCCQDQCPLPSVQIVARHKR
jgi:hypothetical protein